LAGSTAARLGPEIQNWLLGEQFTDLAGRHIAHAHNGTLQAMSDFGLIGFLAWLLLLAVVGFRLGDLHRNIRPYACAAFVSAYLTAALAVDMWTDSFLATLALTAALFRLLSIGSASAYDGVIALRARR
jgi:O-antigen ligase